VASPAACGDQSIRGAVKERHGFSRLEQRSADKGAVDQDGEVAGEFLGRVDVEALGEAQQALPQFELVGFRNLSRRMVFVREFGRNVDLRATTIAWPSGEFANPVELCG
jgi:hypothetical protein